MSLDPELNRQITSTGEAMANQCLKHLKTHLKKEAKAASVLRLQGAQRMFDTIPTVLLEETVRAYKRILDDPVALEALKKQLSA